MFPFIDAISTTIPNPKALMVDVWPFKKQKTITEATSRPFLTKQTFVIMADLLVPTGTVSPAISHSPTNVPFSLGVEKGIVGTTTVKSQTPTTSLSLVTEKAIGGFTTEKKNS